MIDNSASKIEGRGGRSRCGAGEQSVGGGGGGGRGNPVGGGDGRSGLGYGEHGAMQWGRVRALK